MAENLLKYSFLIISVFLVARGDGRWKKKNREDLKHDIDAFKVIADKIEREIELLYEDHPAEYDEDDDTTKAYSTNHKKKTQYYNVASNLQNFNISGIQNVDINYGIEVKTNNEQNVSFNNNSTNQINKTRSSNDNWPKFEDILLEVGKRYDWKNDRWIKLKRKGLKKAFKEINNEAKDHEKHNFKYRLVKINRNKSRRNVVIAVTAVR